MWKSGRVPERVEIRASTENDRIRASTGNVEIRASTGKGRNPGEYR